MPETISPRQQAANEIVKFLEGHSGTFDAPYGILEGLENLPRGGKVRVVTFGCARTLDATVTVWAPTRLTVRAQGPASRDLDRMTFISVESFKAHLTTKFSLT